MSSTSFRVVQLSDTHLFSDSNRELLGVPTADSLVTVLDAVRQVQPELLLLTGDLSQDETAPSYERLRDLVLPLNIPTYWLPGNHDQPDLMAQILENSSISSRKLFDHHGWNFVLLNSAQPGKVDGYLSPEILSNLERQLQSLPSQPTLIALHHPPCPIGSDWMDQISLRQPDDFCSIVERHPQVKLVLFGHIHQEFSATRAGVQYLGCPSTCVQFKPQNSVFAIDDQQPGFRLLQLYADGRAKTSIQRVNYCPTLDLAAHGY
ncbi:MAG: 3',5'-cyclic-AMP phosphodiesterase [Pegethrix bostrychoides GSE-TBD4-15B]|jgi:Icc protein|uniref:3',5'-cyclic-AMP phosphodiesterase n=1 Tax=Pegethrix bostrychoides GSE-TBD4-15B TaxID=2839662 RepID=A0A951PBA7_9CYAN|nr:3',5'-cyclic-AMP phosphodiesterase [Pegethrix bostrychoides GSE-TBD4-15B]